MTLQDATSEVLDYIKKNSPAIIALHGDLGAGKTYFANCLATELGYAGKLQSPTFPLLQEYSILYEDKTSLVHCDFYRIAEPDARKVLEQLGFRDFIKPNAILLIEWPENLGSELSQLQMLHLKISEENNVRNYTIYV